MKIVLLVLTKHIAQLVQRVILKRFKTTNNYVFRVRKIVKFVTHFPLVYNVRWGSSFWKVNADKSVNLANIMNKRIAKIAHQIVRIVLISKIVFNVKMDLN